MTAEQKKRSMLGMENAVLYVNGSRVDQHLREIKVDKPKFLVDMETIKALMARFTYKPNWNFMVTARSDPWNESGQVVNLKIEFYAENSVPAFEAWKIESEEEREYGWSYRDTYQLPPMRRMMQPRRPVIPVGATLPVPAHISSEREFWDWLHTDVITMAENHERDEWFKVDGQVPFDPHAAEKALAAQRARERQSYAFDREYVERYVPPDARRGPNRYGSVYDEAYKMDEAMVKTLLDKPMSNYKAWAKQFLAEGVEKPCEGE
jgi:hypothetical protein